MTGEGAEGRRLALGSTLSPLSAVTVGTLGSLGTTRTSETFLYLGLRVVWESAVDSKVESPASIKTSRGRGKGDQADPTRSWWQILKPSPKGASLWEKRAFIPLLWRLYYYS